MNRELQDAVTKAEDAFHDNKYEEARQWYLRSLTIDSTYYTVMTYIGQTYGIERNWDKAIEWYNKVISLNYIDYMAHWFLADAYQATGRPEEAKKEIITAHILNRNNPRIRTALISILKANHLKLDDWTFNPQYSVSKDANNKIQVKYGDGWLPFALTKAVWAFEPGYRESMGYENENTFRELEEKEALIGMLLSDDPKTKNLPETIALEKATKDTKNNLLQEYIFYEILLPEHPAVAFQLPDNFIEAISTYLLKVRCSKLE
jgi:tetratricopeptide (TPR) repeat protein